MDAFTEPVCPVVNLQATGKGLRVRIPTLPIVFLRTDDGHRNMIHSYFTSDDSFDGHCEEKQLED